jgi:gamma-glutamylcyclotransferase (GGCT)/AIG2-like uncharacterized protein YtfP
VQTYTVPVIDLGDAFPRSADAGRLASDYAELPYPGERPSTSWVGYDDVVEPLWTRAAGTWTTEHGRSLDDFLESLGAAPMSARVPVLAFGSNASPQKVRANMAALPTSAERVVVTMRCLVPDVAAVWTGARRSGRGDVPATICSEPGRIEAHSLQWLTLDQLDQVDRVEGAHLAVPEYRRCRLPTAVLVEDLRCVEAVLVYVGSRADHLPFLRDGAPVRLADVDQAGIDAWLSTDPGSVADEGWDLPEVALPDAGIPAGGVPVFVYGTLKPGESRWHHLEPFLEGDLVPTDVPGQLWDTGLGHPAWTPPSSPEDLSRVDGLCGLLRPSRAARAWENIVDVEGGVEGDYRAYVVRTGLGRLALAFGYGGAMKRLRPITAWQQGPVR